MKKNFTTDAINLKSYPLNDNDSIVVMFSKTKGLMRAVAKGAKRPKSKLGARIQMFIANRLLLLEGKNLDTITEAQSLNTFSKIRNDFDKLSYSMYIAEVVNNFCSNQYNQDENSEEIYNLIFSAYEKMAAAKAKKDVLLIILKFQIKMMNLLGWGIDFSSCSVCQKPIEEDAYFSYQIGSFLCQKCSRTYTDCYKIHNKIRAFLKTLSDTDFNQKTAYDDLATENILEKCFFFMKKYMDNISHKKSKIFDVLEHATLAVNSGK